MTTQNTYIFLISLKKKEKKNIPKKGNKNRPLVTAFTFNKSFFEFTQTFSKILTTFYKYSVYYIEDLSGHKSCKTPLSLFYKKCHREVYDFVRFLSVRGPLKHAKKFIAILFLGGMLRRRKL